MKKLSKIVALTLCFVLAIGSMSLAFGLVSTTAAKALDYDGHWAQATIEKWISENKISGYPDGSFKPDANITRAEFVKLVNGIIDYDVNGKIAFDDVKSGDWYYDSISLAQEIGYISGYSKSQFGPNDNITREQAAAILARIQYLADNKAAADKFGDKGNISSWAAGYVGAASEAGFIKGYDNGSFKPLNKLTRAEALTMLDNVLVNAKNEVIYKAGTELKDTVIEGDLIIAKTVGEGDVHITNVEVKGRIQVYGGGQNSVYFNNVKVAKIEVSKDKVRLVFEGSSKVEEIAVGTETILQNKDGNSTIAKVTIDSTGKVTLTGTFTEVEVVTDTDVILNNATVETLTVEKPINISGTGTIATLNANSDGITYDSTAKITKQVVSEEIKTPPTQNTSGSSGGSTGGNSGGDTVKDYGIKVTASVTEGATAANMSYTTKVYTSTDKMSDFLVAQTKALLDAGTQNAAIESYLDKIVPRLSKLHIGQTPVYSGEGFDKLVSYFNGTTYSGLSGLRDGLIDGDITIAELKQVLNLYSSANLADDATKVKANLASYPFATQTVSYNGTPISNPFKVTYGATELTSNKQVADFVLNNITLSTMTVSDFFATYGDKVVVTSTYGSKTATFTIERIQLQ